MKEGFEEMPKPIGDFIISNATGIALPDGHYYHYTDVIKLLRLYSESKLLVEAIAEPKANYEILREQLLLVAKELDDCGTAATEIANITDKYSFKRAYKNTFEEVARKFGIDLDDDDNDFESENHSLKGQISDLQEELDKYECYGKIATLSDELSAQSFAEHKDRYTCTEIEELMKRGKEFLNQNKINQ